MKELSEPPGGFLIWLIICTELATFAALFLVLIVFRIDNVDLFNTEAQKLSLQSGMILTISLLTSGYFAAEGVRNYFKNNIGLSKVWFSLSVVTGVFFLIYKIMDYQTKIQLDQTVGTNDFWMYYWVLTGFHFMHVLLGVLILAYILYGICRETIDDSNFVIRGGVLFWHMCDAIWLLMFPLFYLMRGV